MTKKVEIYFSEIFDDNIFYKISKDVIIFDKEEFKIKNNDNISKFLTQEEIKSKLTSLINSNTTPIIYLLYTSNPDVISNNILSLNIDPSIVIEFSLILEQKVHNYKSKYNKVIVK